MISALIGLSSCNLTSDNDLTDPTSNDKFMYATTSTYNLNVSVNDQYNNSYYYKVEVFDRNPLSTDTIAQLLTAGVAKGNSPFSTSIAIPQHVNQLYIRQTDPLQRATTKVVSLKDAESDLSCDFTNSETTSNKVAQQKSAASDPQASDYQLPATYSTLGSSAVTLSGDKYFVPAGVTNNSISFGWLQNSELYVAGNVTFSGSFYMPGNCKLIILDGGKVTFDVSASIEQGGNVVAVYPNATLTFNQTSAIGQNCSFINNGTVNMNADFDIISTSLLVNNGTINGSQIKMTNSSEFRNNSYLNLSNDITLDSNTLLTNNGVITATAKIITSNTTSVIKNYNTIRTAFFDMINGGAELDNYCKIECNDLGINSGVINAYSGSVIACKNLYANMTTINMNGASILKTGVDYSYSSNGAAITEGVTFSYGVTIQGIAAGSDIPVVIVNSLNNKNGWQVLSLTGAMEYVLPADQTPWNYYYGTIGNGVSFVEKPTVTINATDCNDGGINADQGTGVPTNTSFPMDINEDNEYTFAMEDLWPNLGDYDMNDFVFSIKNIKKTINSSNQILSMSMDITPRAYGSTKDISAALQFDNISSSKVSVSSTNSVASMETGQSKANVLLFQHAYTLFGSNSPVIMNTYPQVTKRATQSYTFTFTFSDPVNAEDLVISKLNFYVIVGDIENTDRKEIHLAGFSPSDKVQKQTNEYKDSNNMIWAIMIPVGDFKYPTESTKIYDAYSLFTSWASSGGTVNADWYLHPSDDPNLVYSK